MSSDESRQGYIAGYRAWQEQLEALHRVLLEGKHRDPPRLKGLLNREIRAKERYEEAQGRLLGLAPEE